MPRPSTIVRPRRVELPRFPAPAHAQAVSVTRLVWRRRVAKAARWLHIYGSMASLALVLFFAITGITLNHQDWFAGRETTAVHRGTMTPAWLSGAAEAVDKLQVVEFLRGTAGVHGTLSDFRIDDRECEVVFKGPGYTASALIDRASGQFELTETRLGFVAVVNDLHKARDTGAVWSVVVDVAAALLIFISVTGLGLLYFVHKYRVSGALLAIGGAVAGWLFYAVWVS